MFPTTGLFGPCPELDNCANRTAFPPCLFSHQPPNSAPPPPRPTLSSSTASTTANLPLKRPPPPSTTSNNAPPSKKVAQVTVKTRPVPASASDRGNTSSSSSSTLSKPTPPASATDKKQEIESLDSNINTGPPRIAYLKGAVHTPLVTRQKMVTALHAQFLDLYTPGVLPTSLRYHLASRDALAQEASLYARSTKTTYRNACISALARLKKRPPARSSHDAGTIEQDAERQAQRARDEEGRLTRARTEGFVHDRATLERFGYMLDVPEGPGGDQITEQGKVRNCDRCKKEFVVQAELSPADKEACAYHFGKMITEKIAGTRQRVWSCCPSPDARPCQVGPHVFKDEDPSALHSRVPFISSANLCPNRRSTTSTTKPLDLVALDCELLYTLSGLSLARLTVLDASGSLVLDEHVRPPSTVVDLNTRYSGIQPQDLDEAILGIVGVREKLGEVMDENTIVVGHGVENDLKALRLVHLRVIDTAILFPHPNGGTWRYALRTLTKDILKKFIQDSDPTIGHSAKDDAEAALELVRWKVLQKARGKGS
ncbi:hypothetical protein JCM10212_005726 [Sporobolomyces blumeae]